MNLATPTVLAATRACAIALLAVPAALAALRWMRGSSPRAVRFAFAATALVFFTPAMLAGYGWLPTVARWPGGSAARELFYCSMLWVRFTPIAALALWFANPGPGPSASHCLRLAGGGGWRWRLRELGAGPWLAGGVVFLFAFQEFDLATSWGIRSWTVALFDAQVGGLALGESLQLALPALFVELAVITPLLVTIRRLQPRRKNRGQHSQRKSWTALLPYAIAPALFVALPAWFVLRLGFEGIPAWMQNLTLAREMTNSLVLALVCALFAWLLSAFAERRAALMLAVPGLLGTMLLALLVFAVMHPFDALDRDDVRNSTTLALVEPLLRPLLDALGRTLLPLIASVVLQLLPLALLMRALLRLGADAAALHIARSAGARPADWALSGGPTAGAVLLLFGVAYSDFTTNALLAPPQFATVFVRIFNLMHYGQGAVLSAAVFIAVATPLLCLGLTRFVLRLYVARRVR
jgi:ABC-type Fe3+ transport system permease subunit